MLRMLSLDTKSRVETYFRELPDGMLYAPATEEELQEFETVFGTIPEDYRWLLQTCGGGVIGRDWVDGIVVLADSHRKFQREFGPPRGWTMRDVFVIGWDGGGNPFGIERSTGRVLVEDHQFGGIHELAPSFEEFVLSGITTDDDAG